MARATRPPTDPIGPVPPWVRFVASARFGVPRQTMDPRGRIESLVGDSGKLDAWYSTGGAWDGQATFRFPTDGAAKLFFDGLATAGGEAQFERVRDGRGTTTTKAPAAGAGLEPLDGDAADWLAEAPWWQDWSQVAPGEIERVVLPTSDELGLKGIRLGDENGWRWSNEWVWDTAAPPAALSAPGPLGLEEFGGLGRWVWAAVRTAWRVGGEVGEVAGNPWVHVAIWAGSKLVDKYIDYGDRHPGADEIQKRQALQGAEVRERLTTTGSLARQARFRLFYARTDRMQLLLND